MHLSNYLAVLHAGESSLADAYRRVGDAHQADADIYYACHTVTQQCREHVEALAPVVQRYGEAPEGEPERLRAEGIVIPRMGGLALLRDLHDLYALCSFVDAAWMVVGQAAKGLRDAPLIEVVEFCHAQTAMQLKWLKTAMKSAAPQALIVAS
jgi:hypothetical protein